MNRIEMRTKMKAAIDSRWTAHPVRSPSLKDLVKYVNMFLAQSLGVTATLRTSWSSTDRPVPGTRLRHPGRGRTGRKLEVFNDAAMPFPLPWGGTAKKGEVVFSHDSSETYRHNTEVCQWILDRERATDCP